MRRRGRSVDTATLLDAALVVAVAAASVVFECARGLIHAKTDWFRMFVPSFAWWWNRPRFGAGWNPWLFGGFPANADPLVGHVHPFGLLWALLPPLGAAAVEGAAAPIAAGLGMLVYLRRIGCGRTGSVVGAMAFAGAGYVHAHAIHPEKLRTVLAIPWALAAIEALDGAALVAGLGAAVAVLVAGGHPQTVASALVLVAAYAVIVGRPRGRRGIALATAIGLGILVSAVTWLPAAELILRGSHVTNVIAGVDRFTGGCMATVLVPFACGGSDGLLYGQSFEFFPRCGLADCLAYPGMLVWVALLAGGRRIVADRRGRFWIGAAVLGLVVATGVVEDRLPIPGVRAPARLLLWWNLAAAVGAGIALRPSDDRTPFPSRSAWLGAAIVLGLALGTTASMSALARRASVGSLGMLVLATTAATAETRRTHAALVAALVVDLLALGTALHAGIDRIAVTRIHGTLSTIADALAAGDEPAFGRALVVPPAGDLNWASLEHVRMLQGWNVLVPRATSRLLGAVGPGEYEFGMVRDPGLFGPDDRALDLLRDRLVAVQEGMLRDPAWAAAFDQPRWEPAATVGTLKLFANRRTRPVGWIVHRVRTVEADDAVEIVHGRRDPFDPATEALATGTIDPAMLEPAPSSEESVRVTSYDDDAITFDVELVSSGLLVTSELAYPGWTAIVDGTDVAVHEVDAGLRAVVVARGRHEVRFAYRPRLARIGLVLGAIGAFGIGAAAFVARRRPRRSSSE